MSKQKTAIIIGAGPAGLTAAHELLTKTNIKPIIYEKNNFTGGIATTINYKGNRMDLGGHRFFSKSKRVLNFWFHFLPPEKQAQITYQGKSHNISKSSKQKSQNSFLLRPRLSRIYYNSQFYDYPIKPNLQTFSQLGPTKTTKILTYYLYRKLNPIKINNLEDYFINNFGDELYKTFFKTYTEKLWGVPCSQIDASWGPQRTKNLSITEILLNHFWKKSKNTSLIEQFLYPPKGPGQLWQLVADEITNLGGKINFNSEVTKINHKNNKISSVQIKSKNNTRTIKADYIFSSTDIKTLLNILSPTPPKNIKNIADNLEFRDFIVIGILLKKLNINIKDNWIYIHDPKVKALRAQFFHNWSPKMTKNKNTYFIGLEYFCHQNDSFWDKSNKNLSKIALTDLKRLNFTDSNNVINTKVIRVPKAYPKYTGSYKNFNQIKNYLNKFENLYPIGRNGQHRYNNMDHSMLTAMLSVDNIVNKHKNKINIWNVNAEEDYHETK